MRNKGIVIFVVVILAIIAGFLLFNSFLKKNVIESDTLIEEKLVDTEVPSLVVPEQAGGENIFIENVFLPEGGFIVISRDEEDKPGSVIGVSEFLQPEFKDNFLMDIDEEVAEGDVLSAMLYADDGDGVFNQALDTPVKDNGGSLVSVEFNIVDEGALDNEVKL